MNILSEKSRSFEEEIVRSITKKYRKDIWQPFLSAVKRYHLIDPGDKIAVCISGGKDSMLMAKLMQMLQKYSDFPFECRYIVMDPGYNPENRLKIEENAKKLEIPIEIFETDIFSATEGAGRSPCYLCARMRRGHLYSKAQSIGCSKIALGHHFSDVIETTLLGMFYGSQIQAMLPMLCSQNFEGMKLIRPLYCVHEESIIKWAEYHGLEFIRCACRFTESAEYNEGLSKRKEIKRLIAKMKVDNPDVENNIFNSIHAVHLDTMPGYKQNDVYHSFLEAQGIDVSSEGKK